MSSPRPSCDRQYDLFVSLLTHNEPALRRFVRSLLPGGEGLDDVMQNVALECWHKFSEFDAGGDDPRTDFRRWAFVVARFKTLSHLRDAKRRRLVFDADVLVRLADAATAAEEAAREERVAVEACLAAMAEESRRLLLSVHSAGDSVAKIAAETGEKARRLYSKLERLRAGLLTCVETRLSGRT
ncbi:sigma-70 family RNA polymerase sigma factor [Alienimonas sp. DA493]|uniref:sigma-70 family RNA polymerase sigma factor n=1 Tax=Alienimonas sp. DA493 TaxID=3373605 RepID=UPI0037543F0F